jgi:hypothetical protein
MKQTEIHSRTTLKQINQFGIAHGADFLPGSEGTLKLAIVAGAVPKVNTVAAQQVSSEEASTSGTDLKAIFFGHLHDDLIAISRTARTIAQTVPGVAAQFHLPHNLTYGNVPNIARAFATDAAPLQAQFVALELPADFIQHLNDDLDAFEGADDTQQSGDQIRGKSTAGIGQNLKPALDAARALDTIVRNKYANNPAVLAEWTIASHTERAPRPAKKAPATTTTPKP